MNPELHSTQRNTCPSLQHHVSVLPFLSYVMSQVVDPFAIPSIAAKHAALPANVVQAYSLDDSVAQGAVLTTGVVQRTASAVEVSKGEFLPISAFSI